MAERRKKTTADDQGEEGAAKRPRSRKTRAEPPATEAASGPAENGPEGQTPGDALKPQNPTSEGPRVPLPGALYRRQDQWWWRVQLPGEDQVTARPLKTNGEETAADGQEAVEKIALTMWEHAVEENAIRRIKLESTEKIERLKAQFLDKVRHFTELVGTANAKAEAEQRARAEAEARLAQMIQAVGPTPQNAGQAGRDQGQPAWHSPAPARAGMGMEQAEPAMPTPLPGLPTPPLPIPVVTPSAAGRGIVPVIDPPPLETGRCECCDATGVAVTHLTRIDSGQLLCPRCLAALRTDATRSA